MYSFFQLFLLLCFSSLLRALLNALLISISTLDISCSTSCCRSLWKLFVNACSMMRFLWPKCFLLSCASLFCCHCPDCRSWAWCNHPWGEPDSYGATWSSWSRACILSSRVLDLHVLVSSCSLYCWVWALCYHVEGTHVRSIISKDSPPLMYSDITTYGTLAWRWCCSGPKTPPYAKGSDNDEVWHGCWTSSTVLSFTFQVACLDIFREDVLARRFQTQGRCEQWALHLHA